jgi:hypothetical protein
VADHQAGRAGHSGTNDTPGNGGGRVPEDDSRDRRRFLTKGLATGAAALGAWSLASAQPARADTGDSMVLGDPTNFVATAQGGSLAVKNATAAAGKITITLFGKAPSPVTVGYLIIRT